MAVDADRLQGVFAPAATPFDDDRIRFDWLQENLGRWAVTGLAGYLALGTNGEFKSLSEEEKVEVVKVFVKLKADKVLMVGTGGDSVRQTIELTNRMAGLGADYASILPPHYFASKMDDRTLIGFFEEVADHAEMPVLMYNIPKLAANVAISPQVAATVSAHPNIRGMKDSGGASVFSFLVATRDREFSVLAGSANYFLPSLLVGASGGVVSLANCFPDICCELYREATQGNTDDARRLHARVLEANRAVSGKHGVAGVKAAMDLAGYHGGAPRRPLRSLGDQQRRAMREKLHELGVLQ